MSRRATEFHYYDWHFNRWFGSETRARCHALRGAFPDGLLANAAKGIYRDLIDYCSKDGDIPADMAGLAALAGCSVEVMELVWPTISGKFVAHKRRPERLVNAVVDTRRRAWKNKRTQASRAGSSSAQKRGLATMPESNNLGNGRSTGVQRSLHKKEERRKKKEERRNKEEVAQTCGDSVDPASAATVSAETVSAEPEGLEQRLQNIRQLLVDFAGEVNGGPPEPDDGMLLMVESSLRGASADELKQYLLGLLSGRKGYQWVSWAYLHGSIRNYFGSAGRKLGVRGETQRSATSR